MQIIQGVTSFGLAVAVETSSVNGGVLNPNAALSGVLVLDFARPCVNGQRIYIEVTVLMAKGITAGRSYFEVQTLNSPGAWTVDKVVGATEITQQSTETNRFFFAGFCTVTFPPTGNCRFQVMVQSQGSNGTINPGDLYVKGMLFNP